MEEKEKKVPKLIRDLGMMFPNENSKQKRRYGLYKCPFCGKEFEAITDNIKSGNIQSCGCLTTATHGLSKHPLFNIWRGMISRCLSPNNKAFKNYGGRGITVCERWQNPINFVEDMFPSFEKGLTLDRIDVHGNYEPENCRWVTRNIQSQNTRKLKSTNTSGYRGVSYYKKYGKWSVRISVNNKIKYLGYFINPEEGARAYDQYIIDNNLEHTKNFEY